MTPVEEIVSNRDYLRNPQTWIIGHYADRDYNYTHIYSQGKLYTTWVNARDVEIVGKYRWYWKDGYAVTSIAYKRVKMHHLILGKPPKNKQVDHINRNRLDNRRSNLRIVSSLVNNQNLTARGIRQRKSAWEANVCLNYRKMFRTFPTYKAALSWRQNMKTRFLDHIMSGKDSNSFFAELLKGKQ